MCAAAEGATPTNSQVKGLVKRFNVHRMLTTLWRAVAATAGYPPKVRTEFLP